MHVNQRKRGKLMAADKVPSKVANDPQGYARFVSNSVRYAEREMRGARALLHNIATEDMHVKTTEDVALTVAEIKNILNTCIWEIENWEQC
jgi:hypothetical protein